jgi:hypothetical protein
MCYSAKVSISTFLMGVGFSLLLIIYGNPKYTKENTVAGIFLIFVAGIQLMEFLFWIDLHNKIGINKIATVIGSLFNVGQPLLIYGIKVLYLRPVLQLDLVTILNILYFIYLIYFYVRFILQDVLTTSVIIDGHLRWPWLKYANPMFFLLMFSINLFYLTDFGHSFTLFSVTALFLLFTKIYFPYNAAELWCFVSSSVPVIMIPMSYYIK